MVSCYMVERKTKLGLEVHTLTIVLTNGTIKDYSFMSDYGVTRKLQEFGITKL